MARSCTGLSSLTGLLFVLTTNLVTWPAHADVGPDDELDSPVVTAGEFELEGRAYHLDGNARGQDRDNEYRFSVAYSPTAFWSASIGSVVVDGARHAAHFNQVQFESVFQLTPTGRYWADLGLSVSYEHAMRGDANDAIQLGPLMEKRFSNVVVDAQLLASRDISHQPNYSLSYSWQVKWQARPALAFGLQGFGEREFGSDPSGAPAALATDGPVFGQGDRAGPALFGHIPLDDDAPISYQLGLLFGLNSGAADHTLRLVVGYDL